MEVYTPGSIAELLSSGGSQKKKKSLGKKPLPSTQKKNVQFDSNSDEKEHKKFAKTPFSEFGSKKNKLTKNGIQSNKPEKRKLVFDETVELDQPVETPNPKKLKKAIKGESECSESAEFQKSKKLKKLIKGDNESTDVKIIPSEFKKTPKIKKLKKKVESKNESVEKLENYDQSLNKELDHSKKFNNPKVENNKNGSAENDSDHTIFVGNVPLEMNKHKIWRLFKKFGSVKNVRIRCVPVAKLSESKKAAACKQEFHPNRNSLVAFVVFRTKEAVKAAIKNNGMVVDGHHLRIDIAENEHKEVDTSKAIFVGGLPFDVEDDELWEVFEKCGEIESVRVVRDKETAMGKGFGYVNFKAKESVELALKLDGENIRKRQINVKRCTKIKKKKKFNRGTNTGLIGRKENFKSPKKPKKKTFNLGEKKVTAAQVGSATQFQGRKADLGKKKKKKHRPSKDEIKKKKLQKILSDGK